MVIKLEYAARWKQGSDVHARGKQSNQEMNSMSKIKNKNNRRKRKDKKSAGRLTWEFEQRGLMKIDEGRQNPEEWEMDFPKGSFLSRHAALPSK
ncbi:hypothetical protein CEXT_146961 [Caerostris extrusa]|uniref:Uncharacterized protein n=1 Tax=Caerostris extrusa TaxID=172846 RepID=A0AAV4TK91_CAEEX|nr:hypothetical protein CEXT_146961 [Caerostris extrusa]